MVDVVGGTSAGGSESSGHDGTFTTDQEIENLLSENGVNLRTLNIASGQIGAFLLRCIQRAIHEVRLYTDQKYAPADIEDLAIVRDWVTYIACYYLTKREGNPGLYAGDYDEIIFKLEQLRDGITQLPGVEHRNNYPALMQNVIVDNRFSSNQIRVVRHGSTTTKGVEHLAAQHIYDWL